MRRDSKDELEPGALGPETKELAPGTMGPVQPSPATQDEARELHGLPPKVREEQPEPAKSHKHAAPQESEG
jgi:hypothetical protein